MTTFHPSTHGRDKVVVPQYPPAGISASLEAQVPEVDLQLFSRPQLIALAK
jgi:hypothetical protein